VLHAPQHDEQEGIAREEAEEHHRRDAEDVGRARQRWALRAQFDAQHQRSQDHDEDDAAIAQRARERVQPVRSEQRLDPAVLEGDRSGQGICQHDETAAHDEREPPIEPSRDRVRRSSRARAVEAEQPEVLRGKW
jgi:hypothetical protein